MDIHTGNTIDHSHDMIDFLYGLFNELKQYALKGFDQVEEEIEFFREVKPQVLGRLMYYNEVYRLETSCPFREGKMYQKYFYRVLKKIRRQSLVGLSVREPDFYRYFRSGRQDRDKRYFVLGQQGYIKGIDTSFFETDFSFSTYYDVVAAKIICNDLLLTYILSRATVKQFYDSGNGESLNWTATKNGLIELIYALHMSGAVSHGKAGLRQMSKVFQSIFKIPLGDIHHAFHRMKDRAGNRTLFIDQLKKSLEDYMDKDL